jgi:hypothetical protein
MAVVMIQEQPEMFRTETYDEVNSRLDLKNQPPEGLIAHTLGQGEDGVWRVVDIWESREAHDRFSEERLMPTIRDVLSEQGVDVDQMPELKRTMYETYDVYVGAAGAAR